MRKALHVLLLPFCVVISHLTFSQEIAITERGDSVVLFYNGTWNYYDNYIENQEISSEAKMNPKEFVKPNSSNKKINGYNEAYEVWYDQKKWKRLLPANLNPDADIALQFTQGDIYGMVIFEEIEIPIENLAQIALDNAVNAAPDIKMVEKEYRVVNGDTIIATRMEGTTQGMKLSYYSYFLTNENGSIQFHVFTGQKLFDKYKEDIENLLNGLIAKD